MKPVYFILLILMACGFFACTTSFATDNIDISSQPEGEPMNAASFAEFTSGLEELGLFNEAAMTDEPYGVEDLRIYLNENEVAVDFLSDSGDDEADLTLEAIMALRPVRNWSSSITLTYSKEGAKRLQRWLTDNFTGSTHVDLRFIVTAHKHEITVRGMKATEADIAQFPNTLLIKL